MAAHVTAHMAGGWKVEASNGSHAVTLDLQPAEGGPGEAMGPHDVLLAALAGCTTMTLQMYAKRKAWPLEGVELDLRHVPATPTTPERIAVDLRLLGPLDGEQRARLADIAKKCPVYKTLTNTALEVVEQLV